MRPCGRGGWAAGLLVAMATVGVGGAARADQAAWLQPGGWAARRVCDARISPTEQPGAEGGEVAVVTFYSGGLAKVDGSDIRVAFKGTHLVPHRVLQMGPGDLVRDAFEVQPGESRYYVYYGNPNAEPPTAWEPRRGLLLEARLWPGGDFDTFQQVQEGWAKGQPVGTDYVSHVFLGFNPFAHSDRHMVFHYVGWFVPPQAGDYRIAISSGDGAWLLVDGREVVSWPGRHGPTGEARYVATCKLTAQVHRLDYWHVKTDAPMIAVAAWNPPGGDERRYEAIPASAFLPVAEASLVELDLRGETLVADFFPDRVGETWWPDRYAEKIRFLNLTRGANLKHGRFEWDFGDGQKGDDREPTHVYLAPGDYVVSLKVTRGTESNTFRTTVRVERDWWRQSEPRIDGTGPYAEQVAAYDVKTLDAASLEAAVSLLDHERLAEPLLKAATELALVREGVADKAVQVAGLILGKTLREAGRAEEAVAAYRRVESRLQAPADRADVAIEAAETLLRDLHRYDEAARAFQGFLETYGAAGVDLLVRRAHIGLGDVYRRAGDLAKAQASYGAAAAICVASRSARETAVRIGTLARYVEEYTRDREWEFASQYLDEWAWEFPSEKLAGHWSLLRAQALVAQRDQGEALREVEDVMAANPHNPYAVRLLVIGADCLDFLGRRDQARATLQTAVDDYPEDPDQDHARELLKAFGGAAVPKSEDAGTHP